MWRKAEDAKASATTVDTPPPAVREETAPARSVAGLTAEVVQPSGGVITSTLKIKGEIRGREDLYIDGQVEGSIHLSDGRVTVGPHGKISGDVDGREVVVRGILKGSVRGRERVEVGRTGDVRGDIATVRIAIEEGAQIHSKVEITRADQPASRTPDKTAGTVPARPAVNATVSR